MRKKIVAGNWKMNTTLAEAKELFHAIADNYEDYALSEDAQVIVAPPFLYLEQIASWAEEYPYLSVAAQNCHQEKKGAFTGEISAEMLASIGVTHVLIGHSERRLYSGENAALLASKVDAVLRAGLIPIFCCGEELAVRQTPDFIPFILQQLQKSLGHLDVTDFERIIIAYEPVWAIGTGLTASPEQAQEVHAAIRAWIADNFSPDIAASTTILYGGSCNEQNAASLFSQPDVDGGLIGGASLKASTFAPIIQAMHL
jgi:triosephosphate isomerase (TIM)